MPELDSIRRVLIIKLRHHGDVLLTSPLFTVLANHLPGVRADALVYDDTAPLLEGHPHVHRIHRVGRQWRKLPWRARWQQERALLADLRQVGYDLVIHLTEHWRGARLARALRPRLAVTPAWPRRAGSRLWQGSFTHHYPQPARLRHTVEKHLDALRCLGIHPTPDERKLVLVPGREAEEEASRLLAGAGLGERPFVLFHPTSRWLFKCWNIAQCSRFIQALQQREIPVVVTAAPEKAELERVEQILAPLERPVVDLSGRLGVKSLAALTARAGCFVGMDSLPMHIAAAMGTPTVALFGPSGDAEWGPWQVPCRVLTHPVPCRPCGMDGCAGGKVSDCLERIEAEAVLTAVQELMGG